MRLSIIQQFDYWLQLVHPTQIRKAAERVNKLIVEVLENIWGIPVPQSERELDYSPIFNVGIRSLQSIIQTLPVKLGGLGLRDQIKLSPAAYVAGLEQALPFFGGEKGIWN